MMNKNKNNSYQLPTSFISIILAVIMIITVVSFDLLHQKAVSLPPPSSKDVCAIVRSLPDAKDTDEFLSLLRMNRFDAVSSLIMMARNMEQYEAEGYGWQNIINSANGLEPRPGTWLLGVLRLACE